MLDEAEKKKLDRTFRAAPGNASRPGDEIYNPVDDFTYAGHGSVEPMNLTDQPGGDTCWPIGERNRRAEKTAIEPCRPANSSELTTKRL